MKKFCLLLIAAVSLSFAAKAQTADDIIAKYVDAIGGKDKLAQIKSVYSDATVSAMGQDGSSTTTLLVGKGYRNETEIGGSKIIQVYTDKGGWSVNPFAGATDPAPLSDEQYQAGKDAIWLGRTLLGYAAKGYKAELLPKDGNNYPIKVTATKEVTTYYIDASTYLLNKMVTTETVQGQEITVTTTLSNYKKTDFGDLEAYKMDIDFGQFQLGFVVKSMTINKDIDPKIFDIPAK